MPSIRKTINRKLTTAERKRHQVIREQVQADLQAIKARGRAAIGAISQRGRSTPR